MGFMSQPRQASPVSSSNLATQLQNSLNNNAEKLEARKEQALSSFRATVKNLRTINEALKADVALADEMIETCTKRRSDAQQAIKDNEAVCSHILDIIGDVKEEQENV